MHTSDVPYELDGTTYIGYLAVDDDPARTGRRPAVLVCHEGPGLTEHAKDRARRLAALGYVAFALDYHGGGVPVPLPQAMELVSAAMADPSITRRLGRAGLEQLLARPEVDPARVAAIGFCFGGTMALELARDGADLKAVVGFHSGLATTRPQDAANITGSVLALIGADDPMVPAEQRAAFEAEMREAGVDWQLVVLGGAVHSFTNEDAGSFGSPAIAYHQPADRRSWRAMLDLFDEVLEAG